MTIIILLNGPPRSGKDTAAEFIRSFLPNATEYKLSKPLKMGVQAIFDIPPSVVRSLEDIKDTKAAQLHGVSYRNAQIDLFYHLKGIYGDTILTDLAIQQINKNIISKYVIISDCGRQVEAEEFISHYNKDSVGLIRLKRDGCNFNEDSREYIMEKKFPKYFAEINNEHDLGLFKQQVRRVLVKWELIE